MSAAVVSLASSDLEHKKEVHDCEKVELPSTEESYDDHDV